MTYAQIILYFVYLQSMRPKTYWHVISNLFTSPKYYLEIFRAPFWFSLRFFIVNMVILGLTLTWRINQKVIPAYQQQINDGLNEVITHYPPELEIAWRNNQLKSSTNEVIEIPFPSSIEQTSQLPPVLGYFVPEDIPPEQFSKKLNQKSLLVVTTYKIFINNLQGIWTEAPLTELFPEQEMILNKDTSPEFISKFKHELEKIFNLTKQLNFVVMPLVIAIVKFWMGLLEALLIFLFFKLNRFNINFTKTLQFSLHLVVIAEIITQTTSWIYPNLQFSMFTLSYWSIFSYIFWTQRKLFYKVGTTFQD